MGNLVVFVPLVVEVVVVVPAVEALFSPFGGVRWWVCLGVILGGDDDEGCFDCGEVVGVVEVV